MRVLLITGLLILVASSGAWAQGDPGVTSDTDSQGESVETPDVESTDAEAEADVEGTDAEAEGTDAEAEGTDAEAEDTGSAQDETSEQTTPQQPKSEPEQPVEGDSEPDKASAPPVQVSLSADAVNTRMWGSLRSEMIMSQKSRLRSIGGGRYVKRETLNVYPFMETVRLHAEDVGVKGLSIHLDGWMGIDLADVYFDNRVVADPTYLYIQYNNYGFDIKAGRQVIYSGAAEGLHLDGLDVTYQTPINLGLQVFGGWQVYSEGPNWYRDETADSFDDFGEGFSEWDRDIGDFVAGGRLFYRMTGMVAVGASFVHVADTVEIERQVAGADLYLTPVKWLAVTGDMNLDIQEAKLRDASLAADFHPIEMLSFGVEYSHADPTLFLSKMSIFSVFSNEEYDSVGLSVQVHPLKWLDLHAGYHQHFYGFIEEEALNEYEDALEVGYELHAGGKLSFGPDGKGLVMLDYRRFDQDLNGMNQLRLGASVPIVPVDGLRAAANLYLDIYDEEMNDQSVGFLSDMGVYWGNEMFDVGGTLRAGLTPYVQHEVAGLLKFAYNFDVTFSERRQP